MGAASLNATLNCEAFASKHRDSSHFDKSSFVGMAWRPAEEKICCEVYSTGRAKYCVRARQTDRPRRVAPLRACMSAHAYARAHSLPGSTTERDLHASFARMLPELLRFSSASRLLEHVPERLQSAHRVDDGDGGEGGGGGGGGDRTRTVPTRPASNPRTVTTTNAAAAQSTTNASHAHTQPRAHTSDSLWSGWSSAAQKRPSTASSEGGEDGEDENDENEDETGSGGGGDDLDDDQLDALGL